MNTNPYQYTKQDVLNTCFEAMIKPFEGFVNKEYLDSAGIPTIGYGTTDKSFIARYKGKTVLESDARKKALQDLETNFYNNIFNLTDEQGKVIKRGIVSYKLTLAQAVALLSFAYNCGVAALSRSTLLRCINNNASPAEIDRQFKQWVYAGSKEPNRGLVNRRAKEAKAFNEYKNYSSLELINTFNPKRY